MSIISKRTLFSLRSAQFFQRREFWNWLHAIWNKYDKKRVDEVGPDRACAEWLLRCGGSVRFKSWGSFTSDYNAIPSGAEGHFQIEEIRAVDACINSQGFAHLNGLKSLKKIHLEKCQLVADSSIARFNVARDTLQSVTLIELVQISENGLAYLAGLKNLKELKIGRLVNVKNVESIVQLLKDELPSCKLDFNDEHPPAAELKEK